MKRIEIENIHFLENLIRDINNDFRVVVFPVTDLYKEDGILNYFKRMLNLGGYYKETNYVIEISGWFKLYGQNKAEKVNRMVRITEDDLKHINKKTSIIKNWVIESFKDYEIMLTV